MNTIPLLVILWVGPRRQADPKINTGALKVKKTIPIQLFIMQTYAYIRSIPYYIKSTFLKWEGVGMGNTYNYAEGSDFQMNLLGFKFIT